MIETFFKIINSLPIVIIFAICCAGLYPMAKWVFPYIKNKKIAALIHIFYGVGMLFLLFGRVDALISISLVLISYFLIFLPPLPASIISFSLTMFTHLYIFLQGVSWAFDLTGFTMCLYQRISSLTFNIEDGKRIIKGEKLRKKWEEVSLDKRPSFLYYCAYVFTPYGSFCNPFIEFKLFDYILERGNRPDSSVTKEDHKKALFRYFGAFLQNGFIFLTLPYTNYSFYQSSFYLNQNIIIRLIMLTLFTATLVARYFCAWWLVEAGFYEFGLSSFNKLSDKDDITNLSLLETIKSGSCQEWMRRWNHTTHLFWKNYLFTRLLDKKFSSTFAQIAVFVVSMSWHGCRPVFYLLLPETFLMMTADDLWNKCYPQNSNQSIFITLIHIIWVFIMMMYSTCSWFFPWVHQFFEIRKSIKFLPPLMSLILFLFLKLFKKKKIIKKE